MSNEIIPAEPLPPQEIINDARDKAKILKAIVTQAHLSIKVGASYHLKFEAWQTLGRFTNITTGVEWTRPLLNRANDTIGYEARALAYQFGNIISAAEAQCTLDEYNWKGKELWQLRSMAQTRACAKALRNVLAWIVVLAGYETTPAEEYTAPPQRTKQDWRWFRKELAGLGISHEEARDILGVKSIKDDWIGKQGRTLEEAIETIKEAITETTSPKEAEYEEQGTLPTTP